ncbi:MAG: hypothetical protein EOO05_03400 [Chitinophagaceae bacterium]|nr:MAG: hypothetical protein EOO05_03400 [Chitinophagaceae bacterium]
MANKNTAVKEEHKDATAKEDQAKYITDDGTDKPSSTAARNREKIGQDESYTVVDERSQSPGTASTDQADQYADLMDEEEIEEDGNVTNARERKDGVTKDSDTDEVDIVMGTEADVTEEDIALLGDKDQDLDGGDDEDFNRASLDDTDEDGDPLNENSSGMSATGDDLDMPEEDDQGSDDLGNEDEENKYYSLGSDDNDGVTEGTP